MAQRVAALIFALLAGCAPQTRRPLSVPMRLWERHAFGRLREDAITKPTRMIAFAPDGSAVAYAVRSGDRERIVRLPDPLPDRAYDRVGWPVFSESGRRLFFLATEGEREAVVGTEPLRWHAEIVDCRIIGEQPAYVTSAGELYLGGELLAKHEAVVEFAFRGDTWACIGVENGQYFVSTGQRGPSRLRISELRLTDRALAWIASDADGKQCVVVNDIEGPKFDHITDLTLVGDRPAYFAREGSKTSLRIGGTKGPEFDACSFLTFSADGSSHAYVADEAGTLWLIVNGEKFARVQDVTLLTFAPDCRTPVYVQQGRLMVGNRPGPSFDAIMDITFAGNTPVYRARRGAHWHVVVGRTAGEAYDFVGPVQVSPDGRKVAFGALKGNELFWEVLDVPQ